MSYHASHRTGRFGERLFDEFVEQEWISRPELPDIYIDRVVEVVGGPITGRRFAVQVKTQTSVSPRPSVTLDTTAARYFVDECPLAVFVVLVDKPHRRMFARYVQAELIERAHGWRKQRTVRITFADSDLLTSLNEFALLVAQASDHWAAHCPGMLRRAITYSLKELKDIDPRFDPELRATQREQTVLLNALEDVSASFSIRADKPETQSKIQALFDFGSPLVVDKQDVMFEGLPLFQHFLKGPDAGRVGFEPDPLRSCRVGIADAADNMVGWYSATVRRGVRGLSVTSDQFNAAVRVSIRIPVTDDRAERGSGSLEVQLDRLVGSSVRDAGELDALVAIVDAIEKKHRLDVRVAVPGGDLRGTIEVSQLADIEWMHAVRFLESLRIVATHFKVPGLVFDKEPVTPSEFDDVDVGARLIRGGRVALKVTPVRFTADSPVPTSALDHAPGTYLSARGEWVVEWRRQRLGSIPISTLYERYIAVAAPDDPHIVELQPSEGATRSWVVARGQQSK